MHALERLFKPKSIAIVGASRTPGKLGHDVLLNTIKFGYAGKVYAVNPHATDIAGVPTVASVNKLPSSIDVAVIVVPAMAVNSVLQECGKRGIPFAVIISAGFKEIGEEGVLLERQIQKTAKKYGIRIVGPNCLGFMNANNRLNASFATGMPSRGNISFLSQSGAMAVAMLDWAYQSSLGFSHIISVGNKSDINEIECLEYFAQDRATQVIMMYLESIDEGREFMQRAARIALKKPIIILKAGTSAQAQKAIQSHTGSLAGSSQAIQTAFEYAGIIAARTVEEFFDYALAFSQQPLPKGNRVAIVTNAGGPGIMATDATTDTQIELPQLSAALQKKLRKQLPDSASTKNPIDVIGDASSDRYEHALNTILASKEIDGAVVILTPQIMTDEDSTALVVARAAAEYNKPILASFMGGLDVNSGRMILNVHSIPNYETPERAVRAMDQMIQHAQRTPQTVKKTRAVKAKKLPTSTGHPQIRTLEAEALAATYKLPILESKLVRTLQECKKLKSFPLVMKIASRDIIHKAANGAVELNINSIEEARQAFTRITQSVRKHEPNAEIEGVLVQPQLQHRGRTQEIIIGMKRDVSFGPLILFGLGGALVELFHDVSFGFAPLTQTQALQMIERIKTASLLKGLDTQSIAAAIVATGKMALDYPEITTLDMNPMIVHATGADIVDIRMMTL